MGFPAREHTTPREASTAVHTASFAQDVVLALSRILHQQALSDRDRRALQRCHALLERLASTKPTLRRPGERALSADMQTLAAFRAARSARAHRDDVHQVMEMLERALTGSHGAPDLERIRELREVFLSIGQLNLKAMAREEREDGATGGWIRLTASSPS